MNLNQTPAGTVVSFRLSGLCLLGWLVLNLAGCSGGGSSGETSEQKLMEDEAVLSGDVGMEGEVAVLKDEPKEEEPKEEGSSPSVLMGAWQRPDGGYILQVKEVRPNGTLDAAYFNPNPIHVGAANWRKAGSVLKIEVLLDDVNYQGSNYTLVYDADKDTLEGVYYQAVARQSFQIHFVRHEQSGG